MNYHCPDCHDTCDYFEIVRRVWHRGSSIEPRDETWHCPYCGSDRIEELNPTEVDDNEYS